MAEPMNTSVRMTPLVGTLLALTVVTGMVDAMSLLALGRVFTANMTGNLVLIGFAFAAAPAGSRLVSHPLQLRAVIVSTGVAMGLRNAIVRKLAVPDMTTTVLTLTITGLAADSSLAGGENPRWRRRVAAILAMIGGAFAGARMLAYSISLQLAVACGIAAVCAAARRHLFFEGSKS